MACRAAVVHQGSSLCSKRCPKAAGLHETWPCEEGEAQRLASCLSCLCNSRSSHQSSNIHQVWRAGQEWKPSPTAPQLWLYCTGWEVTTRRLPPSFVLNQPVEEWVRAVGGHGPGVLGHRGGNGVCAAILIHTSRLLIPYSELLWTIKHKTHEQHNPPRTLTQVLITHSFVKKQKNFTPAALLSLH